MADKTPIICGVCKNKAEFKFCETSGEDTLWECPLCFVQFWHPFKNPGREWSEFDPCLSYRNVVKRESLDSNHKVFLREKFLGSRLLDVGMGTGNFLMAAKKNGYDVYGLEVSREHVRIAKGEFGLENVFAETVSEFASRFNGTLFDVVTFFEVLEHLDDPAVAIESAKKILRTGGYLAISVPWRHGSVKYKVTDRPPKHLTRWDEKSMTQFLESHGFRVVRTKRLFPPFSFYIAHFYRLTRGYLNFNIVGRVMEKEIKKNKKTEKNGGESKKVRFLRFLAAIKDWILFLFPSVMLFVYLVIKGKHYWTFYTLAKRVE